MPRIAAAAALTALSAVLAPVLCQEPVPTVPAAAPAAVTVATHYFYWYRWPDEHFNQPGAPGPEGHRHHFPEPERVSYLSADWHRENFAQMASCGIDVALPVYWGAPGAYDRPNLAFSRRGLPPMVQALDDLARDGQRAVRLGLFYDTSTLRNGVRGASPPAAGADLTTATGRALFCDTVTDYFAAIPQRHWARHRGGPLVVLYSSSFAHRWDRGLGDALRQAFEARFPGERPCLVADASWGDIGQDLTTGWGAALWGPRLHPGVAQIGPGYDDRPVPGRSTPIREREGGAFYVWSWQQALRHRPELVLLETWNEMHEGTEICWTLETGEKYLELTAEWTTKLRAGVDPGPDVPLQFADVMLQPDRSWGDAAAGADAVHADYGASPPVRSGLRERAWEDGPIELRDGALVPAAAAAGRATYLYFQVSDHFAFDTEADFELTVRLRGGVPAGFALDYDARSSGAPVRGAYRRAVGTPRERDGDAAVVSFRLERARLGNRQNGGSDFRLVLPGGTGAVVGLRLSRVR